MKKKLKGNKSFEWDAEILELEKFFGDAVLPEEPVMLNKWTKITDIHKFIDSHFATVKAQNGNRTFLPYLNRLQELKRILTQNKAL